MERRLCQWGAVLLLGLFFALALSTAVVKSATMDEGFHLAMGYAYLKTGDLRFQHYYHHPRLAGAWAALPLLLDHMVPSLSDIPGWSNPKDVFAYVLNFYYDNPDIVRYTLAGRVQIVLLGVLLGALVFRWAREWFGWRAGLLACFLYTFSPNILAHSGLITTDLPAALACLATMVVLQHLLCHPSIPRAALMGLVLGGALLTKYSTVLLVPVMGALLLLAAWHRNWRWTMWAGLARRKAWVQALVMALLIFGLASLIVWAGFVFEIRPLKSVASPFPVPLASLVEDMLNLRPASQVWRPAFLLGQRWGGGRWYYYPATVLFKTPPPALLLFAVASIAVVLKRRLREQLPLWLFPVAYFLVSLTSGFNIGHRHLLPVLPFGCVFVSQAVPVVYDRLKTGWIKTGGVLLLVWYLGISLWIYPDYLAYFNLFAGGPSRGYQVLVDSNLDWGQDLIELRHYMERKGLDEVWLSLFSTTDPALYGIRYRELPDWVNRGIPPEFHYLNPAPGVYVIGATLLQGLYLPNPSTFDWFLHRDPLDQIGYSMLVYQVDKDPVSPAWVGMCYAPESALSPDEIAAGFGRTDLRLVYFDCRSSWVLPRAGPPGWYVIPASADDAGSLVPAWLPGMTLEFEQQDYVGHQGFAVYRLEAMPVPLLEPVSPVWVVQSDVQPSLATLGGARSLPPLELDGPASFLGYRLNAQTIRPGNGLILETFWEARRPVTDTMPSVFAHLVDGSGKAWSVGDALTFPAIQWQDGDIFAQQHMLELPLDIPAGTCWIAIGLYNLTTGIQYPVRGAEMGANTLLLGPVVVGHD